MRCATCRGALSGLAQLPSHCCSPASARPRALAHGSAGTEAEAPTLSGYGGPGAGAEVIVGSHLYGEEQGKGRAGQGSAHAPQGVGAGTADGGSGTSAQGPRGGSGRSAEAQSGYVHSAGAHGGGSGGAGSASGIGATQAGSGGARAAAHGYAARGRLEAGRRM